MYVWIYDLIKKNKPEPLFQRFFNDVSYHVLLRRSQSDRISDIYTHVQIGCLMWIIN